MYSDLLCYTFGTMTSVEINKMEKIENWKCVGKMFSPLVVVRVIILLNIYWLEISKNKKNKTETEKEKKKVRKREGA